LSNLAAVVTSPVLVSSGESGVQDKKKRGLLGLAKRAKAS
jgi:hypothetical protein